MKLKVGEQSEWIEVRVKRSSGTKSCILYKGRWLYCGDEFDDPKEKARYRVTSISSCGLMRLSRVA